MENDREMSGNFNFSQGYLEKKMRKVMEKVRDFENFQKKFIVYRLLKSIISINCKRFKLIMVRNITFIIVMV